jgi:hypothetical protein
VLIAASLGLCQGRRYDFNRRIAPVRTLVVPLVCAGCGPGRWT